jgi:hypothetical protein
VVHEGWRKEIDEAKRRENWSVRGPNRPVKVVPLLPGTPHFTFNAHMGGFFTLAKFIRGLTPRQIEKALGLPIDSLKNGAMIYSFKRLPQPTEYAFELTAARPDGLAATFMSDPSYPVGSGKIPQWQINSKAAIPVDAGVRLSPQQAFYG